MLYKTCLTEYKHPVAQEESGRMMVFRGRHESVLACLRSTGRYGCAASQTSSRDAPRDRLRALPAVVWPGASLPSLDAQERTW